ncbi:MAG: hypothetical protein L0J63_09940 [Tetragenococcus koreensis]|nr:hypothetical protein [Tetragenococcus koreensis]MDN6309727.1 CcoQ/FixQ family Cbb3-type cytochrome c oxidase assembly chaperone [Psychroflexus sp.]
MLKFIKENLDTIKGIEVYPIIALLIFFTFFVGLFWWVMTYNKKNIKALSELPLDLKNENES